MSEVDIAQRCLHFAECGIICTQLFFRFMKDIPEFYKINSKDRLVLMKSGLMMALYIRGMVQYDKSIDRIYFINYTAYTREQFYAVGHKEDLVNDMYDFYNKMSNYPIDPTIAG